MRPLEGLCVLDFTTLLPGPLATLLLAESGAEVVKVERPGTGDEMRRFSETPGMDGAVFALLNRGKKSIEIDLKADDARRRLMPLIKRADILVEQFRPGVMDRLGLSYDDIRAVNPAIVYCSITGYGQTGVRKDAAGHDLNYLGDTGLLALSFGSAERPVIPPALVADIAAGAYPAVMNILLALMRRTAGSGAVHLDISMTDNLFPFASWAMALGAFGRWPGNGDALLTGGSPRYGLYRTQDGLLVAAAPLEDRFWRVFCDAIGLDAAARDDLADPAGVKAHVASLIAARPAAAWRTVFAGADCCCSIVATLAEAMADLHFTDRGLFAHRVSGPGLSMPALPVPIVAEFRAPAADVPAPSLGAHTADFIE